MLQTNSQFLLVGCSFTCLVDFFLSKHSWNVQFWKISIYMYCRYSVRHGVAEGVGGLKSQILKQKYETKLDSP